MESHFIEGFDNRYSIMADGNIVCHYRYNRSNGKVYYNPPKILSKNSANNGVSVSLINIERKAILCSVFGLMCTYFNISKPDNLHRWLPYYLDGNSKNHEISNLSFRLFDGYNCKHKIRIFENKTKTCNRCGKIKKYEEFEHTDKGTLKLCCKSCLHSKALYFVKKYHKDNPERVKKTALEYRRKNPDKFRGYNKKTRLELSDSYVKYQLYAQLSRLGVTNPHITQEMIDLKRIMIQCTRLIREQ